MESFASLATCNGGSGGDERPGSVASMASKADSVMTKSGIFKDARDTPSRRLRHKDGRLLRGGLGLTTGLGWSDSEDEDAPSPFTRRVSSAITLSRKSSLASLGDGTFYGDSSRVSTISSKSKSYGNLRQSASVSSLRHAARAGRASTVSYAPSGSKGRSSKLSRSYSSRDLADFNEDDEVDDLGFRRDVGDSGKSKVRSHGSQASDEGRQPVSKAVHEEYVIQTPSSTTSSVSIPLPVTPKDYEFTSRTPTVEDVPNRVGSGYQRIVVDKDKMLPPLPNPRTGSIRRPQAGALAARRQASAAARAATLSIATAEGITLGPESSFVDNGDSTSTVGNSTTVTASTLSSIPMRKRSGSQSSSLRTSSSSSSLRNAAGSAASQSEIPPVPSLPTQPLKQLQLPRYSVGSGKTNTHKQSAVPVPSISQAAAGKMSRSISSGQSRVPTLATSVSMGTLRGSQGSRTAPTTPVTPTTPGKPRTGTGMVYRSSGSVSGLSALKLPTSRNMGGV
ncbi:hypothetical protein K435DRAFT_784499 [Dendrothele bispora CBS 962.96]|uniref:Uncharacterized protein n=1 Tax=Dendrothele bispora (strain CBS 962.96) TaxID=1314807 RepID=A0A4S8L2U4_DENBC|nr:hypothetical protein K435DRAFT_784499 [Dendrothele bispora CBS 962.96]